MFRVTREELQSEIKISVMRDAPISHPVNRDRDPLYDPHVIEKILTLREQNV